MTVTIITQLHATAGKEDLLAGLLAEGRDRMRAADGCESFELVQDDQDPCSFAFLQRWASHQDHDTAFNGGIVKSCGSARPADHAATSSCFATVSTNTPFRNFAPARTRATSAAPLT